MESNPVSYLIIMEEATEIQGGLAGVTREVTMMMSIIVYCITNFAALLALLL